MSLEERALHFRNRVIPVRGVLFEERLVTQQAADPASQDDAGPVADRASERDPGGCGRVGVSAVLDLVSTSGVSSSIPNMSQQKDDRHPSKPVKRFC